MPRSRRFLLPPRDMCSPPLLLVFFVTIEVLLAITWLPFPQSLLPSIAIRVCFQQCPYSARTVPVQCPHSARWKKTQCPHFFVFQGSSDTTHLVRIKESTGTVFFSNGHCAGIVRALYGHCTGTVNYPSSGPLVRRGDYGVCGSVEKRSQPESLVRWKCRSYRETTKHSGSHWEHDLQGYCACPCHHKAG